MMRLWVFGFFVLFCILMSRHYWSFRRKEEEKSGVCSETGRIVAEKNCEHFNQRNGSRHKGREESGEFEAKAALVY